MLDLNGNQFVASIVLIIVLALSIFVVTSAREWALLIILSKSGIIKNGELIVATKIKSGKGFTYRVEYTFYNDNILFHNTHMISKKSYFRIKDSQRVMLKVLPSRPRFSRLWDGNFDYTTRNLASYAAFAGFLVFPPYVIIWLIFYFFTYIKLNSYKM